MQNCIQAALPITGGLHHLPEVGKERDHRIAFWRGGQFGCKARKVWTPRLFGVLGSGFGALSQYGLIDRQDGSLHIGIGVAGLAET